LRRPQASSRSLIPQDSPASYSLVPLRPPEWRWATVAIRCPKHLRRGTFGIEAFRIQVEGPHQPFAHTRRPFLVVLRDPPAVRVAADVRESLPAICDFCKEGPGGSDDDRELRDAFNVQRGSCLCGRRWSRWQRTADILWPHKPTMEVTPK
jgi:hypothetical protein